MLRAKISGLTVTGKELYYAGSITLDTALLEAADILPGEQVEVLNQNNGARFTTYTIAARRGCGQVVLNGPAARLGEVGDRVIILSYVLADDQAARKLKPHVVQAGPRNRLRRR